MDTACTWSTPLRVPISFSISVVTRSLTSSGLAPGYTVAMISMGISMVGISSSLAESTDWMPNTIRHSTTRMVVTGRLRENFVKPMAVSSYSAFWTTDPSNNSELQVVITSSSAPMPDTS